MPQTYTVVIEKDADGWLVSDVVELPGCHTQARTHQELMRRTKEAIAAYRKSTPNDVLPQFISLERIEV